MILRPNINPTRMAQMSSTYRDEGLTVDEQGRVSIVSSSPRGKMPTRVAVQGSSVTYALFAKIPRETF